MTRKPRIPIVGIQVVLVGLLTFTARQANAALQFLHTEGQNIVNESGQKIRLRGLGLGNWLLPEGYMWKFGKGGDRPRRIEKIVSDLIGPENAARFWREYRSNYITEADIRRIAELGFNSVRPALNARLFLTEGKHPRYVRAGFATLDNLVGWCRKYGVYVIIDMHAAPGGQTGANIDDSRNDEPELFSRPENQERLVHLWTKIASRYKDEPTVAGYDLLNEPLPERTGAAAKYKSQLEPLYRRVTKAIRQVDTRHLIIVEGANWANDWSAFTKPFDPNLVYQFHYYCWNHPDHLNDISGYLRYRDKFNAPVWVGETGEKDKPIYWATTDYFEANNIGWAFWPWKKMDARNAPYSYRPPENWDEIAAYSRGGGKPSAGVAQEAFNQLLRNIRLQNCQYFPDVVNSILRRVPGKVEAENYGHGGLNVSYYLENCSQKSKYYRPSEPVPIELIRSAGNRWNSQQAIRLGSGEWTAYTVGSRRSREFRVSVRAEAARLPAAFDLSINGQGQEVKIDGRKAWRELNLQPVTLSKGANRVKLRVLSGTVNFDWMRFE
jgi:Cellulase (glycosyl hydrolase family 5)